MIHITAARRRNRSLNRMAAAALAVGVGLLLASSGLAQARKAAAAGPATKPAAKPADPMEATHRKLSKPISVDLKGIGFDEALDGFAKIAGVELIQGNVTGRFSSWRRRRITLKLTDAPAYDVLRKLIQLAGGGRGDSESPLLGFGIDQDGRVEVAYWSHLASPGPKVTVTHEIGDLVAGKEDNPKALSDIRSKIFYAIGRRYQVHLDHAPPIKGKLVITTYPKGQLQIISTLCMLRDGAGELDEARLLTKKLGWKIKSIRLHGVPFRDVVPYLRDRFDVNIEVDWAGLAQAGVDLNAPLRINVRNCTFSKLLWSVADGVKTDAVWPGIVIDGDTIRIGKAGRRPGLVRIRMRGKGKFRLNARHLDGAAALRKEIIALELPKRAEAIITVEAEASQAAVADLLRLIMAAEIQNIRLEGNGRVLPTPDRKASRAK